MKTKTVVELTQLETTDALIAKAKEAIKHAGGSATVKVTLDDAGKPVATVTFEWAKGA